MKALNIDSEYYLYPESIRSLEEFIDLLESGVKKFIKLEMLSTENCVPPFFIAEDTMIEYQQIDSLYRISESDITVLSRVEYNKKLLEVEKQLCKDCKYDEPGEFSDEEIIKNSKNKLSLDGKCLRIEENWDEEE